MNKLKDIETHKDIIASSPWVITEGLNPLRIVIRDLGNEYVVHDEVLTERCSAGSRETFFVMGYYTHDIVKAFNAFNARAKKSLERNYTKLAKEVTYV